MVPPGGNVGRPPGGGGTTAPTVTRIVADPAVLAGKTAQAGVILATGGGAGGAAGATYQWSISGGRLTSDPTRPNVQFIADATGSITLNVAITIAEVVESASAQILVLSAADAGKITVPATAATNVANITATVPAAQNDDRTFRWTVSGAGAAILGGQGTNAVTVRPGSPGLVEVTCNVTLQRLLTVPVRAFVLVTGDGPTVALTVNGGSGGGTFPSGSRVDILADPPPSGQVFDQWTGDTAVLGNAAIAVSLPHIVVTVPATPTTLTATYKTAPAWAPVTVNNFNPILLTGANGQTTTFNTNISYHLPAGAKGVVFLLHDLGEAGGSWFTRAEQILLARDLVAAGYGVAALDSVNRNTGAWGAPAVLANNPDALSLIAALDRFAREGLAANAPVFLLGFGPGGDAAVRFADLLATATPPRRVKGTVLFCATGGTTAAVTSHVPALFALASHDNDLGTAGNAAARENSRLLAGRGVGTAVISNNTSPVHSSRIRRIGVNSGPIASADVDTIRNALQTAGWLDANYYPTAAPSADAVRTALPAAWQARAADIAAQLAVAFGAHELYGDGSPRIINFLNSRASDTPVPPPGRLVNLSTRTKIAYLGDTFTLGFNVAGPERATLLIRGIGPALGRFGIEGVLPLPRLEVNQGATLVAANEGWEKGGNAAQITAAATSVGAFALMPGDADAALLLTLEPGTYTATITGRNGASGDVLAEVYDVSRNASRLTNLSTLGKISEDGEVLVPGLVIVGNNPRTLMVRAIGPGLTDFGLGADAVLGDPRVTVLGGNGQAVAANNNWSQGGATGQAGTLNAAFPAVGAFPLRAANSDAALVAALAPGNYTLQAGAAPLPVAAPGTTTPTNVVAPNTTGSVLVEVYEVP